MNREENVQSADISTEAIKTVAARLTTDNHVPGKHEIAIVLVQATLFAMASALAEEGYRDPWVSAQQHLAKLIPNIPRPSAGEVYSMGVLVDHAVESARLEAGTPVGVTVESEADLRSRIRDGQP